MNDAITMVIADDHAVMRDAVVSLVQKHGDMRVVGLADDGVAVVERCRELRPNVALVDLSMPRLGGLDAIAAIREASPTTRVVVLTMHDDQHYLRSALTAGAAGYVLKRAAATELLEAIREVHAGRSYIRVSLEADRLRGVVAKGRSETGPDPREVLSARELEVLRLVALGHTDKEVASQLGVAAKSVGTYRARVRDKLGLTGRASMVRCALKHGLMTSTTR